MTLLDYPSKVACTVFLGGCNFRCPFCHNAPLVLMTENGEISTEELLRFLRKRSGVLDGVCITGGEPLINEGLEALMREIRSLGYSIKLDTNGSFPERLNAVIGSGLADYIAMDIKNSFGKYAETAGADVDTDKISKSIDIIMSCGISYEFRTTIVRGLHTDDDFERIGKRIRGAQAYYLQNFVNSGSLIGDNLEGFSKSEAKHFADIVKPYVKNTQIRGI